MLALFRVGISGDDFLDIECTIPMPRPRPEIELHNRSPLQLQSRSVNDKTWRGMRYEAPRRHAFARAVGGLEIGQIR